MKQVTTDETNSNTAATDTQPVKFYKKVEATASNDEIATYYVMSKEQTTLLIMNRLEPVRYIISYLPGTVEETPQMHQISQSEFLAAAARGNNAACWYIDFLIL